MSLKLALLCAVVFLSAARSGVAAGSCDPCPNCPIEQGNHQCSYSDSGLELETACNTSGLDILYTVKIEATYDRNTFDTSTCTCKPAAPVLLSHQCYDGIRVSNCHYLKITGMAIAYTLAYTKRTCCAYNEYVVPPLTWGCGDTPIIEWCPGCAP